MLVGFSFKAKPGKTAEMEKLLNNPDMAARVAKGMGAKRNTLFFQNDRLVRILEFPDGVTPRPLSEVAKADPEIGAMLKKVGELADPGYAGDDPAAIAAFTQGASLRLVLDVHT